VAAVRSISRDERVAASEISVDVPASSSADAARPVAASVTRETVSASATAVASTDVASRPSSLRSATPTRAVRSPSAIRPSASTQRCSGRVTDRVTATMTPAAASTASAKPM
jgi:hypothetical protein